MKILPVIDLSRGQALHAVGGDRAGYQPVKGVLAPSADPLVLARVYRERLGLEEVYLADLDSIAGREPQWEVYRALLREDFALMVDAGVRDRHLALALREWGVRSVVAGLETLEGPQRIPELVEALGQRSLVLGIDLRDGAPLGDPRVWGFRDPGGIAAAAAAKGVTRFLLLDLARVGTAGGPPLEALKTVQKPLRAADLLVGGGIRNLEDLKAVAAAGARGALLASALHSGAIEEARRL